MTQTTAVFSLCFYSHTTTKVTYYYHKILATTYIQLLIGICMSF